MKDLNSLNVELAEVKISPIESINSEAHDRAISLEVGYFELAEQSVQSINQLEILRENCEQLVESKNRLSFLLKEVKFVIKA